MAKRPWFEPSTTFALNIGDRTPGESVNAIGWAVLQNPAPKIKSFGEFMIKKDAIKEAVAHWNKMGRPLRVQIIKYEKSSFQYSVPASEGMSWEQHVEHAERLKLALEEEGAKVSFEIHFPAKNQAGAP